MDIHLDNLNDGEIIRLLEAHLAGMYAMSPPENVHALQPSALKHPTITFWCAKEQGEVLGCIALQALEAAMVKLNLCALQSRPEIKASLRHC
jgi:putative acetyltransferase